jgi:hypothetical protein
MRDPPVPLETSPGDPPRSIGYRTLLGLLPGNLQIIVLVYPLLTIVSVLWFTFRPNEYSGKVLLVVAAVLPIYAVMIERFRRKLQRYQQVVGTVIAITAGAIMEGFGGCKVLHYQYEYRGGTFRDEHMTADPQGLRVADAVWVLVDPNRPSRSVMWVR